MKFLNVYCEARRAEVYISVDKIVLLQKLYEDSTLIELEGGKTEVVKVALSVDELVRKINGEDKVTIGFRAGK